jgi:hypothetical protein
MSEPKVRWFGGTASEDDVERLYPARLWRERIEVQATSAVTPGTWPPRVIVTRHRERGMQSVTIARLAYLPELR